MISYTSMWYWLTLARMEMFSRTYLKRTWWSNWHCTFENELGIIPVGIPWSLNTFYSIWLFVRNELIRISCNALASICSWPMRKINMLHEKIVRLGTSFQMVKDFFFSDFQTKYHIYSFSTQCASRYAIFNWQRGIFYGKSSEVTPSPCEHVSSDEDCSSRTTNCR